jgi:hypothetical protein
MHHNRTKKFHFAVKFQQLNFRLKSILKKVFAYAIMPIGKKKSQVHADKKQIPKPCCSTVWGFFFSFIVAKHPLG